MAQKTLVTAEEGVRFHYDLPPEFFKLFLDPATMSYSCAYFRDADTSLEEAQQRKLALVARKLALKPGDQLLDIGVGWGNLALYAADLGCRVTGMTLAPEQARYVQEEAARRGLSSRVEILVGEARTLPFPSRSFDKVATIGATEHIEDLGTLFAEVARIITPQGLLLQHAMTASKAPDASTIETDFLRQHIFPVGRLKSLTEYVTAMESAGLEVIDVHNITDNYALTLHRWLRNLESAGPQAALAIGVPVERFRAQLLFLAGCCVTFAEGHTLCYQELARRMEHGAYRNPLQAGRERYALDDGPSQPIPPPVYSRPLVEVEVGSGMSLWVEGIDGSLQLGAPPRQPDCKLSLGAETLDDIRASRLPFVDAYLGGLITVEGDPIAAVQVRSALLALAS